MALRAMSRRDFNSVTTPRVATMIDWLIGAFDASKYPWFRDEFIHPSAFNDFDSRHWQDNMSRHVIPPEYLRDIG